MREYIGQILFFILLIFCALSYPQSVNTKNLLDTYKDIYLWQEPRNNIPVSDSVLTVLGRWAWGPSQAVDADSNFAYIGNGPTFHILDISNPSNPIIYGEYLTEGYVDDIKVRDNIAFISIGLGLLILDVSDPSAPEEISFIGFSGGAIKLSVDDSYVYVITSSGLMRVIDISDIRNPFLRGSISAGGEWPTCVEARNSYVYIGNPGWPLLQIVDATNPDSLTRTFFDVDGSVISAFIKDTLLFIGVSWFTTHLKIYNISSLAEPEFIGQVEINDIQLILGITVSENGLTAYNTGFGGIYTGIYSIDISDLTQPKILDKFERARQLGGSDISLTNNTLVAAYFSEVSFINISNPDSLTLQSFFPTGGSSDKIYLRDSLAFVASGLSGLWILDVTNPEKPKEISNINTNGFTSDLVVEDTLAYIVNSVVYTEGDTSRGLWIIDVSNIYEPVILSHYIGIVSPTTTSVPNSITKTGNLILITQTRTATSNDILEIIDVTNPYQPISLGIFNDNLRAYNSAIKDSIVFLATSNGGLRIIDISQPEDPIELSNILNSATGVAYKSPYVFTSTSVFSVINVDDPKNPFVISSIITHSGSSLVDLIVSDNYAYWADWSLGVIDISNPENPIQITAFTGKGRGRGVAAMEEKIFFADQQQGVWILRNNIVTNIKDDNPIITKYKLYQNYPNPFNPVTIIEFEIPQKEKVLIEVFDLLGQRIKTLMNEEIEKGKHKINFNAIGLSSGIYFYRIRTKETTVTKKMVLLR